MVPAANGLDLVRCTSLSISLSHKSLMIHPAPRNKTDPTPKRPKRYMVSERAVLEALRRIGQVQGRNKSLRAHVHTCIVSLLSTIACPSSCLTYKDPIGLSNRINFNSSLDRETGIGVFGDGGPIFAISFLNRFTARPWLLLLLLL